MADQNKRYALFFLVFFLLIQNSVSWSWFSSSEESPKSNSYEKDEFLGDINSEFSMQVPTNTKGKELMENAKKRIRSPSKVADKSSNLCWQSAYQNLFSACKESLAHEEKRIRFAWDLTDCFQKETGRPPLRCEKSSTIRSCLAKLDNDTRKIYLEFSLEANALCHQLQAEAFNHHTERLVNELKNSAQYAEEKLDDIEKKAEDLLQHSHQIHDSLDSIDVQTKNIAELAQNVEDRVDVVLKHSEKIYEKSQGIAASQLELQQSQATMRENIESTMHNVEESQREVGREINNLKNQAVEIENEIVKVGNAMYSKMGALQDKADEIGNMAGTSLEKQKQLLDGQSLAFEGLQSLTQSQTKALEESRDNLQQLAELGSKQQQELLRRQEQLQQTHDRLVESSKTILAAQEDFESKQASMFVVLDKLFALQKAMLLESRGLKALFIYSISIFILYILTSTKQTYAIRPRLYIGLCASLLIEFMIIRCGNIDTEQQAWIISVFRSLMVVLASVQLLYSIYTYRDYEVLNHQMLLKLNERLTENLNRTEQSEEEELPETDDDVDWSTWVDTDINEELDSLHDPDYLLPEEESGENSLTTTMTKKYNLRRNGYHS